MSDNPPTTPATAPYPEPTQAEQAAMMAAVFWVHDQRSAGHLKPYEGMYIAVLNEKIIDSDADEDELGRRLDALGDALPPNRAVVQYVPRLEDWNWK